MSYQLGDDTIAPTVTAKLDEIIARQKAEESRRSWTMLLAIGSALFAAARLGIVAIPFIRARRAAATPNPARRRRR